MGLRAAVRAQPRQLGGAWPGRPPARCSCSVALLRRGTARHRVRCWSSSAVLRASSAPVLSHTCCAGARVVLVGSSLPAPLHEPVTSSAPSTDASSWSRRPCVVKRPSPPSVSPLTPTPPPPHPPPPPRPPTATPLPPP